MTLRVLCIIFTMRIIVPTSYYCTQVLGNVALPLALTLSVSTERSDVFCSILFFMRRTRSVIRLSKSFSSYRRVHSKRVRTSFKPAIRIKRYDTQLCQTHTCTYMYTLCAIRRIFSTFIPSEFYQSIGKFARWLQIQKKILTCVHNWHECVESMEGYGEKKLVRDVSEREFVATEFGLKTLRAN